MSLASSTVVVLGGSSGIGLATAKAALAQGAQVTITGRSADRLAAASRELGGSASAVALDAADEAGTRELFGRMDRVDHVFVTAGAVSNAPLKDETATMRPMLDVRFWGALYAAKYASPKMAGGASITFMSGTSVLQPRVGASVGSASCGAVEALARSLALELAPVRVNTIRPGFIDTPLIAGLMGDESKKLMEREAARLPVKRIGTSEDVAHAVLFLMTNGFVTGITLTVDGGRLLL